MQESFDSLITAKIKESTDNGLFYCTLIIMPCYKTLLEALRQLGYEVSILYESPAFIHIGLKW